MCSRSLLQFPSFTHEIIISLPSSFCQQPIKIRHCQRKFRQFSYFSYFCSAKHAMQSERSAIKVRKFMDNVHYLPINNALFRREAAFREIKLDFFFCINMFNFAVFDILHRITGGCDLPLWLAGLHCWYCVGLVDTDCHSH